MKKKILVIDDEESVRSLLNRILTKNGYEVILSPDGEDALLKLSKSNVDLIMLDMNMPKMNGLEFLKKLRDDNITLAPVLMVTGSGDQDLRIESYKLGVYDFIRKPEQYEVMLKRVENGLKIGEMINFNESIKVELLMAKKLQQYLFPGRVLETGKINVYTWTRPLTDVGGDLFDYVKFGDGSVMFFVADVSGHGISAALYTAIVKMVFRNALRVTSVPGEVVAYMNEELSKNLPIESFVTLFCGLLNPEKGTFQFCNAGHPKPLILDKGEVCELDGHSPFLGPIHNAKFENFTEGINPGWSLFIYTDGFQDITDSRDMPVGLEMLWTTLEKKEKTSYEKFEEACENILKDDVLILDDCTIMMIELVDKDENSCSFG